MTMAKGMTAAMLEAAGAPLRVTEMARPEAGAGQVLVRISASGVNPLDVKIHAGRADHARHPLPAILGLDLAGVVEAVGQGVTTFAPGDEVYGMTGGVGGIQGTLAEFAAVDARLLARKPSNLTMREAAALPLVAITAWEGLVDRANVRAGQTVLIHGGGGGVGHVALQIARARGAEVYALVSDRHKDAVARYGGIPIDYRATTVQQYVNTYTDGRGFDIVYDTVGGDAIDAAFQAVRFHGHVVSCLGWSPHALAPLSFRGASFSGVFTLLPLLTDEGRAHHGDILRQTAKLVEAGELLPRVDGRRFTLHTVCDAYRAIAAGHTGARLVIEMGRPAAG